MTAEQLTENWDDTPVIEAEPRTQPPIHWRRPDGSLACGAEHNPATWRRTVCCRTHPVAATCTDCVTVAAAAIPAGGITCTCGHTIPEDGECCCPSYCPTCSPEDCCAEAWAVATAKAAS